MHWGKHLYNIGAYLPTQGCLGGAVFLCFLQLPSHADNATMLVVLTCRSYLKGNYIADCYQLLLS